MPRRTLALVVALGVSLAAVAAAAPGKLDPGFGNGGIVVTATAPGAGADFQNGLVVQSDGRIVVGGESDMGATAGGLQWRLLRYTHKGELDLSFGVGGTAMASMSGAGGVDEIVWDVALQPDGKIVAAGDAMTVAGGFDVALARFNPDGSLDGTFGSGGKVTTAIGPGTGFDRAFEVTVLDGGKILVAGFADMGPGAGRRNFMLARYNPDGALDGTFGSGGIVITRVAPGDNRDQVSTDGLTIDAVGRIVVGGAANMGGGAGGFDFAVARYLPDGTLDPSFDGDGVVTTPLASGDEFDIVISLAIDASGKILAAGVADQGGFVVDWALARYNTDGSLDPSFGSGGKVLTNLGSTNTDDDLEEVVIQSSGKILVGGSAAPTVVTIDSDFAVGRYNPDGSLDRSFGNGGIVLTNTGAGNGSDEIYGIALSSDAKLVVSGECDQTATGRDVCLARYKAGEDD
jgi:uncharacterized delta-60 repeat protein